MTEKPSSPQKIFTSGDENAIPADGRRYLVVDESAPISKEAWDRLSEAENLDDFLESQRAAKQKARDEFREREIRKAYGETAQRVQPYRPNRKQRRAQHAAERKYKKEKK